MDLQLPGMTGLEAIRAIRGKSPAARIVVLTMYQGDEDIHRALEAGAMTYVLKDTLSDDLMGVFRDVQVGERPLQPLVQARLAERTDEGTLTLRECQVIELIWRGMRNKEIAALLGISEQTVQVHVKSILAKFNVHDRTAAVNVALHRGIIHIR
jgi:DNA-binding NarL/FixJ family response regulator